MPDQTTCNRCAGSRWVCENHQDRPWGDLVAGGCSCGAGAPCPEVHDTWPLGRAS